MARANPLHYRIRNWDQFQHYRDRNPKWVKLHYETLSSSDWVNGSDADRALMVVCMLVASRHGGQVPNDMGYLRRVGYLNVATDVPLDLSRLVLSGFLEPPKRLRTKRKAATKPLQNARPEKESEIETEKIDISLRSISTPRKRVSVSLPDWIDPQIWKGYEEMRQKMRAPLTERAKQTTLGTLDKLRAQGHDANAVLDQSIQRGWRGVFPIPTEADGHERDRRSPHAKFLAGSLDALQGYERQG